jgi:putative FmdB family regulatory protein
MPIYEFACQDCGHEFEKIQSFSDSSTPSCPNCQGVHVQRRLSAPAIHFKGSGWYITDSKNAGKGSAVGAGADEGKGDGKGDGKGESKDGGQSDGKAEGKAGGDAAKSDAAKGEGKSGGKSESSASPAPAAAKAD